MSQTETAPPPGIDAFPSVAIEEVVTQAIIESIVKGVDKDLELVDFTSKSGTEAGDGYSSVIYAVEIEAKSRKTGETQKIRTMLKTMPRHPMRQMMIVGMQGFVKEQKLYEDIFPSFLKFQIKHGISDQELFTQYPKCYSSFSDGQSDYLALENLRFSGFRLANRQKGLDFDHCCLILKSLARFHALSFTMHNGSFKTISEAYPELQENVYVHPDKASDFAKGFLGIVNQIAGMGVGMLKSAGLENEAKALEVLTTNEHFAEIYRIIACSIKYAVIGHDLGYFLYSSPQMDIVNGRIEELLEIYHNEFTSFAKKLGYENSELTFNQLLEEWEDRKYFGVASAILLTPIMSAKQEDVVDFDSTEVTKELGESVGDALNGMMKNNDGMIKRLVNLTQNHLLKVPFVQSQLKNAK